MPVLLELHEISKSFAGVPAVAAASLEVSEGQAHALVGENGAGKSTLMKIISGSLRPDAGALRWRGEPVRFVSPRQAASLGIALAHQEPLLAPHLTVAENMFLGHEPPLSGPLSRFLLDDRAMLEQARRLLEENGLPLDPSRRADRLSAAERQILELARALVTGHSLLILDEPTSSLSERETEIVMRTIGAARQRGAAVIYISHRLEEVRRVAQRITILRDGRSVYSGDLATLSTPEMIRHMAGRDITVTERQAGVAVAAGPGAELLRVERLSRAGRFREVSFALRAGEILGVSGLVGAGRTELCEALFGVAPADSGVIFVNGRATRMRSPRDARRAGLAMLTEDRQRTGVLRGRPVMENMTVAALEAFSPRGLLRPEAERAATERLAGRLRLRGRPDQRIETLSGGNQQKALIARWMLTGARIFLFDEPARGIDVTAKAEVFALMRGLAAEGAALLMVSSEIPELLQVADRLLVMRRGEIAREMDPARATREEVLHWAL